MSGVSSCVSGVSECPRSECDWPGPERTLYCPGSGDRNPALRPWRPGHRPGAGPPSPDQLTRLMARKCEAEIWMDFLNEGGYF